MSGERVVPPAKADVKDFERRLSATAVTHDAADFGVVARPRLWWTRVAWQSLSNQADAPVKLKWSTHQGLPGYALWWSPMTSQHSTLGLSNYLQLSPKSVKSLP